MDLLGVGPPPPFLSALRRLSTKGVPYGGGFLSLTASQSKGVEEEIEGVDDGGVEILYDIFVFLGVDGLNAPVCLRVDAEESADMVLKGARCVTLTLLSVTEHVWGTPTSTSIAFGSDASAPLLLLRRDDDNALAYPGHYSSGETE